MTGKSGAWAPAIFTLGLFLAIAGSRLLLLHNCGTDLPQFDAWGVEGEGIFKPYFNGTLTFADFFAPCNEHRVAISRLFSLLLLLANGLWDNQLQAVVNALIYSAFAALLFLGLVRRISGTASLFLGAVTLAAFAHPFGWENALWGFQLQFYLLVALSVALLYAATGETEITYTRIALIGVLQFATLFTMASGVLASVALLAIAGIASTRSWSDRRKRRLLIVQIAVSLAVILFWKLVVYFPVSGHDPLKASSLADFAEVLAHCLSWPFVSSGHWWIAAWLPWTILMLRYLCRKDNDSGLCRFAIALGIWVLLQAAATAYARNTLALGSKYADPLSLGMLANGLAIVLLARTANRVATASIILFALFWMAVSGYALYGDYRGTVGWILPEKQQIFAIQRYKTRAFLATGAIDYLIPEGKHQIPDRDFNQYARKLTDPVINHILPRSVNREYAMTGLPSAPLSRMSDFLTGYSLTILIIGAIIMAAGAALTVLGNFKEKD